MSTVLPLPPAARAASEVTPDTASPANIHKPSATARLALSRERLRTVMLERSAPKRKAEAQRAAGAAPSLLDRLKDIPGAGVMIDAVSSWWSNHPLHAVGVLAAGAARASMQPLAQRNPVGLVLLAAVLGAALVWSRPWRWLLKPALFAGLVPQIASKLVRHVPMESWMGFFSTVTNSKPAAPHNE